MMTSDYISKRCGSVTISLANSMAPQTPLFSPVSREISGYRVTKSNNTRPLMYPEEILQMDNKECLLLIRGQKPLKAYKVIPDELSTYKELKYTRVTDYIPSWRKPQEETETVKETEKTVTEQLEFDMKVAEKEESVNEIAEEKNSNKQVWKPNLEDTAFNGDTPENFCTTTAEDMIND